VTVTPFTGACIDNQGSIVKNSQHLNTLRRLFYLQCFSLPRFVANASPHVVAGDEHLLTVIERIVSRQEHMTSLVADAILAREGRLPRATFPLHFTGLHNLEMRYLLTRLLEEQRAVVSELNAAATILAGDAEAQELARELRRNETSYLLLFEELCSSHRSTELAGVDSTSASANDPPPSVTISANGSKGPDHRVKNGRPLVDPFSLAC
jgi:hypothetical protein